ncbi:MAG: bifunctional phosphoglucose/phosphomannose isomerase [Candidatus Omnitrophica bacterium]|nr:bifunctional phosphoglucose/phosphomannose isomerase [Candidatus Omnitrophota bacterium]
MNRGFTAQHLKKIDRSGMVDLLMEFPLQCQVALRLAQKQKISLPAQAFTKIVFVGQGGSAIGADLVRSFLYFQSKIPVFVVREYELPAYVDARTLVFILSYSGNTEETLSAYAHARKRKATVNVVSSGGILKEYALRDKVCYIQIPAGLPPRTTIGYLSIIPLYILSRIGVIKNITQEVDAMVKVLEDLKRTTLGPSVGMRDNTAKSVAGALYNKFAFIYSHSIHFDTCVVRLRSQICENAKALSNSNFFPELNHNEIVGWDNPKKLILHCVAVILRDTTMHAQVAKRMDITAKIIRAEGVRVIEVWSHGKRLLSRIFSLIYIGDFISYYLAILYGVDPTPVERITYLKQALAKQG